jgi:dynein light chain 1
MSKGLAIKDALKIWEDKHQKVAAESQVVKLFMMQPFIIKMDASLSILVKCEYLH